MYYNYHMKTKQRLTMIETDYKHIDVTLNNLVTKMDKMEGKIYIGMGLFLAVQLLISSGIIKVGV